MRRPLMVVLLALSALVVAPPISRAADPTTRIYYLADVDEHGVYGLYSRDLTGGPVKRLVAQHVGIDMDAAQVSPDGTQVAYLLTDKNATQLWTVDVGGFNAQRLRVFASRDDEFDIRWSPDGTSILFNDLQSDDPRVRVFHLASRSTSVVPNTVGFGGPVIDPSNPRSMIGSRPLDKVVRQAVDGSGAVTAVLGSPLDTAEPTVSADGKTVAFTHVTTFSNTDPRVDLLSLHNGERKVLATGMASARPTVGPDDIVYFDEFANSDSDFIGNLYSVPIDGSAAPTQLTDTDDVDEYAVSAAIADTTAPTGQVSGLRALIGTAGTRLYWTPPSDPDATDVWICRTVGTTAPTTPCTDPVYAGPGTSKIIGTEAYQTYSYTVFTADHAGNVATTGQSITTETVVSPHMTISSPTSQHTAGQPFRATWGQGGNDETYYLSYQTKSASGVLGPMQTWTTTTDQTGVFGAGGAPVLPVLGESYYLTAYAEDPYGNATPSSTARGVVPLDDTAAQYGKGWATEARSGRWLGSVHTTTSKGAAAEVRLDGASYSIIGERCTTCGTFRVYVDGVLKATVSTQSSTYASRQTVWTGTFGPIAARNLRIVNVSGRLNLDGFATYR